MYPETLNSKIEFQHRQLPIRSFPTDYSGTPYSYHTRCHPFCTQPESRFQIQPDHYRQSASTDGTTEAIDEFKDDERLIHLIPERNDLGIGGCWNLGVHHPLCGKFAVQLDSDDVYAHDGTLQVMVNAFYEQNCAMVVGTYMMTDFDMNMIAPGIIDHKEWTPENGRNNALRINGLGAPRAFYTPILRELKVPNTSYGEDYALGLNFSRQYQIGRVYEVVYLCRRWDDNSDASLDIVKMNAHNLYKDRIRTWELQARIALNKKQR